MGVDRDPLHPAGALAHDAADAFDLGLRGLAVFAGAETHGRLGGTQAFSPAVAQGTVGDALALVGLHLAGFTGAAGAEATQPGGRHADAALWRVAVVTEVAVVVVGVA